MMAHMTMMHVMASQKTSTLPPVVATGATVVASRRLYMQSEEAENRVDAAPQI